jgi:acyl carrier protein
MPHLRKQIEARVKRVLRAETPSHHLPLKLHRDLDLLDTGTIDSQTILAWVLGLEMEFQIAIDEATLTREDVASIRGLTDLVSSLMASRGRSGQE